MVGHFSNQNFSNNFRFRARAWAGLLLAGALVSLAAGPHAATITPGLDAALCPFEDPELTDLQRFGVKVESLRLAAAGNMIDFRYRIVDPAKARMLVDRTITPYLIEQSSGKTVEVPKSTKIGPLRQTTKYGDPPADRVFFVLFGNPGGLVQPGSRVTVVVGDFRAEDLIVE